MSMQTTRGLGQRIDALDRIVVRQHDPARPPPPGHFDLAERGRQRSRCRDDPQGPVEDVVEREVRGGVLREARLDEGANRRMLDAGGVEVAGDEHRLVGRDALQHTRDDPTRLAGDHLPLERVVAVQRRHRQRPPGRMAHADGHEAPRLEQPVQPLARVGPAPPRS